MTNWADGANWPRVSAMNFSNRPRKASKPAGPANDSFKPNIASTIDG